MAKYDSIKLDCQLCFPLYVCSKELIRSYKKILDDVDLTYTQYIVMMFLWNNDNINVKCLGETLYLDSGTLTPLLKKLENKGYIKRGRLKDDERNLVISLTKKGWDLREEALKIPKKMACMVSLSEKEASTLLELLNKIMVSLKENRNER